MQVRKLIRLLNEAIKENPGVAYMETCIDREYVDCAMSGEFKYISVPDIGIRSCVWNPEETINECQRNVMVLGTS